MKKTKRLLPIILTIATVLTATCAFTACFFGDKPEEAVTDTQEATLIMEKAVEKMDAVSQMLFVESENSMETTGVKNMSFAPKTRSSVQYMSASTIPSDVEFYEDYAGSVVEHQLYVNYPYHIINYILQNTTKAHKLYGHKYKVGETVYGTATKTINTRLNEIFENSEIEQKPTLAINIKKEKGGLSFVADWDWRNEFLRENVPKYYTTIMVNGQVKYDRKTKQIDKVMMAWHFTELNDEVMASVFDFEEGRFYYIKYDFDGIWKGQQDMPSIVDLFNKGELTYDTLRAYPHKVRVAQSNIATNFNELDLQAMIRKDNDINAQGELVADEEGKETSFATLYNAVYDKVRDIQVRDEKVPMSLNDATEVDFMNDAVLYGLKRTEFIDDGERVYFIYPDKDGMLEIVNELSQQSYIQNDEALLSFIEGAKKCFNNLNKHYVGEEVVGEAYKYVLGEYHGKNYTLEYVLEGSWSATEWKIICDKLLYKISDGEHQITFEKKDSSFINVKVDGAIIVGGDGDEVPKDGVVFTLNEDGQSFSVSYHKLSTVTEVVIPETYQGLPVTKIADRAFQNAMNVQSLTIPASITAMGNRSFMHCQNLKKVNFLGTVNQWAEIDFSIAIGAPTQFAGDLYINGELLTSAHITATKISDWAFYNCKSLTSVTIGDNVQSIGANAFANCSSLGIEYGNAYYIGTTANPYKVLIRAKSTYITSAQLHQDTEIICGFAFNNCLNLQNVQLNEKLTVIGDSAFQDCQEIRELYLPASVTKMSASMFGMNAYWVDFIQFNFEIAHDWCAVGGGFDKMRLTIVQMKNLWARGVPEVNFIR